MPIRHARGRGLLLLRGVAALLFGVAAVVWPEVTVLALALLFGAYALVDGVGMLAGAVRRGVDLWCRAAYALGGVPGMAAGLVTLLAGGDGAGPHPARRRVGGGHRSVGDLGRRTVPV